MFGLKNKVEYVTSQLAGLQWVRKLDVQDRERLEKRVDELTRGLEWHVGTTLEILLAEERILKLRIAEKKRLIEETGSTELVNTEGVEQNGQRTEVGRA